MQKLKKIGFGGGCHWCTEAVFMALKGVAEVEQGFIAPKDDPEKFSEAVVVHFDKDQIILKDLIEIHLNTHKSSKNHSMRHKYRSAIYFFEKHDEVSISNAMLELQENIDTPYITSILSFGSFKRSEERFQNYYFSDTTKPFCERHIAPKIRLLKEKFPMLVASKIYEQDA